MSIKRLKWVDIFKGILIVLMVIGHSGNVLLIPWIYSFHMAAFFYISGFTSDLKKEDFITYIKKKFKALVIPFIIINVAFFCLQFIMSCFDVYDIYFLQPFQFSSITNFFKYMWTNELAGATWFLIVLFFSTIFCKLIYDYIEKNKKYKDTSVALLIVSSILVIINYYLFYNIGESLPLYLDLIPLGTLFISIGYFIKNNKIKIGFIEKNILKIVTVLSNVYFVIFDNCFVEWTTRTFPNFIVLILSTFGGIFIIEYVAKLIEKIKVVSNLFEYIGKNTIAILLYHFVAFRIIFTIFYHMNIVDITQLKFLTPQYSGFIMTLLTAIFAVILSLIIDKIPKIIMTFIKNKKVEKIVSKNICVYIFITLLIFIFNRWALSDYNFFIFDDFNNLATIAFQKFSEVITILPTDVYCSRSGGWFIVKILLYLFGHNYLGHAVSMLLIHSFNAILVYKFTLKLLENNDNKKTISIMASLIFALYPISTFASFWEAGMFDLFGTTLTLLCLNLFLDIDDIRNNKNIKKVLYIVLMTLFYYISLRTKEMFIALPVGLFCISFVRKLHKNNYKFKEIFSKNELKKFFKKNIYLIILNLIMLIYFGYTRVLNASSVVTHDVMDAYYYTFNPLILIKNLFTYIYIYFNVNSLVYGDVTTIIKFSNHYKFAIFIIIALIMYISIKKILKKDYSYLVCIGMFIVLILPVLPMANMRHVLYLYAPSIFLSIIISLISYKVFSYLRMKDTYIIISLVSVLFLTTHAQRVVDFRKYWLDTAYNDKLTYNYLKQIKKEYQNIDSVYVINVPQGYTSFTNGPGFIIMAAFDNNKIKVHINDDNYDIKNKKQLIIDYNNKDYKIIKEEKKVSRHEKK